MHPLIVIPARFGSVRIPGKPLSKIHGEPLIALVARTVLEFDLTTDIVVATDDLRVSDSVSHLDVQTVITSSQHRSGTERVAEVATISEFSSADPIMNIQGDQPFLPRTAASGALERLIDGFPIGTAAARLQNGHEGDVNRVKVCVDRDARALSFSREMPSIPAVHLHLGVYAYTRDALLEWVSLPPTPAEYEQGLEQLRPLLHGTPIGVAVLDQAVEHGIDTPGDVLRANQSLAPTRTNV